MPDACRSAIRALCSADSFQHSGLALARYLLNHATKEEKKAGNRPETRLLESARQSEASDAYRAAFARWKSIVEQNGYLTLEAVTAGSLAIGLGNESPLEVGLTIHHTYGMPVIPGSAVKGLCRRVAARLLAEQKITQEQFDVLFGDQKAAGCFVFHDAWYDPSADGGKPFHRDVVTVHHPKYYRTRGEGERPEREGAWPTDFDDPTPVPFLVVRPGARFLFAVECPNPDWKKFVAEMLKHALAEMGIGAKTNAGYGRFHNFTQPPPPDPVPVEETWKGVAVTRKASPLSFTVETPHGTAIKIEGKRADEMNLALDKEFRERLKKRPNFKADVVAEVKGDQVTIKSIQPAQED